MLLTAAKNEAAGTFERAIQSVLRQTWRPRAWFIVDDGSTDNTAILVGHHAAQHPFIHLVCQCRLDPAEVSVLSARRSPQRMQKRQPTTSNLSVSTTPTLR